MNNMFRCDSCKEPQDNLYVVKDGRRLCRDCAVEERIQQAYNREIENLERASFIETYGYDPMEKQKNDEV